jgi:hypothetical protein
MRIPSGLTACGLILAFDETIEAYIAHVAMVLSYDEWTDDAVEACEQARSAAWDALAPLEVTPNLLYRTRKEHAEFQLTEPQWTPIANVDC